MLHKLRYGFQNIGAIYARSLDPHKKVIRPDLGHRFIPKTQDIGTSDTIKYDCSHFSFSFRQW